MRGTAEDRAGAVLHQHEIRHIDRELPALDQRMQRLEAGVVAAFFRGLQHGLAGAHAVALGDELIELRVFGAELERQRVVRRERHEGGAIERVRAGREDLELLRAPLQTKEHARALGAADPVLLHQPHALGPAVERLDALQEIVGISGDAQAPLGQQPFLHKRARAPAAAVDHLLVGEHGVLFGVPIDPGFPAVGEACLQEIQEHLLLVLVIAGMAGRDLAPPVVAHAHALELRAHGCDVLVGPGLRMHVPGDGGVLRR